MSYIVFIFPDRMFMNVGFSVNFFIRVGLESSFSDVFNVGFIENSESMYSILNCGFR